ncbi:hypothetical protein GCM10011490_06860 [Pseudoclavibacter endophyticus]|uniref:Helix-turn-helix domain-containing protein n=1 Tax=Pseudoclavibacter endophyticus TaxID=1778590 RepID=A0A6H9WSC3_9MICO|nr:helix-turn-helix domain-containing protein [Pseudoclavibacter endophyticus]KAB1649827.1 helix-turn-helix domain-containing protein [Pseudoclavibacter endophyticus]GGA59457.1 hypothetical protein GCM10011490_06860 [Pseudoclavibacter endophyticus]
MTTLTTGVRQAAFPIKAIAQALGVHQNSIYAMTYDGTLATIRVGRSVRIPRAELERLGWPIPEPTA